MWRASYVVCTVMCVVCCMYHGVCDVVYVMRVLYYVMV